MEPIISPWIIYVMGVLGTLKEVSNILVTVCLFTLLLGAIMWPVLDAACSEYFNLKKAAKCILIVLCISGIGFIFIPTKEDMLAMLTFSYVTPDNIQLVQGNIIDFVQQIMETVKNK